MNIGKFDQKYKFLSDYNYEMSKDVPDNLNCGKCKNILINACQVPCGCRYCRDCVNEMLKNGIECCPGNTDDCKNNYLSHNQLDYSANVEISKLVLKCPEEMCLHECELIDMEEHLRICGKKSVKCPFSDIGCDDKNIPSEMINEHCQLSNFSHSKILIEIIYNIRNEIDGLKAKEEENKNEIEKLKQNIKVKDKIIGSITEEVKLIKLEKEKLWQEFKSFKENFGKEIEETSVEMKNENLQSIESINIEINRINVAQQVNISKVEMENKIGEINEKIEKQNEMMKMNKDEHMQECEILRKGFERKTKEILAEMQKEKQARIESLNEEIKSMNSSMMKTNKKFEMKMETRINELSKFIESKYPVIEWTIDKLDERRTKCERIESEYFTRMMRPYKLQLLFCTNGWSNIRGKGCSIYLYIYPSPEDELPWPFKADVTIKIVNKTNPSASESITKYCQMDKPPNDSYYYSDGFNYSYSKLTKSEVISGNCIIVECFVNFK